jgi:hypothetical protein
VVLAVVGAETEEGKREEIPE